MPEDLRDCLECEGKLLEIKTAAENLFYRTGKTNFRPLLRQDGVSRSGNKPKPVYLTKLVFVS